MNDLTQQPGAIDRLERLISRHLDGEITAAEQRELDAMLAADADARAIFEDYCHIDARAGAVLRMDLSDARDAQYPRQRSPWWTTIFTAVSAAAAVVALSFLFDADGGTRSGPRPFPPDAMVDAAENEFVGSPIDYRTVDFQPTQRVGDWRRDLIGIRGKDPNVILIVEQATQTSGRVPIYGDF
jgi:hypothetical protein